MIRLVVVKTLPAELRRAHGAHPVAAVQSEYSLSTRGGEVEAVIDGCSELGALFVPFSPLGRGLLTGAYRGPADFKGADFRTILPRFQPSALEHNLAAVDRLAALAEAKGCSAAQLALAWVLARGSHVVPIPGTRRLSRLEENVGALELRLTPAEIAAIDQPSRLRRSSVNATQSGSDARRSATPWRRM